MGSPKQETQSEIVEYLGTVEEENLKEEERLKNIASNNNDL